MSEVVLNLVRKAAEISWDPEALKGRRVRIVARNPDSNEVSSRESIENDGLATLTFPLDYHGDAQVVVYGAGGSSVEGTITV